MSAPEAKAVLADIAARFLSVEQGINQIAAALEPMFQDGYPMPEELATAAQAEQLRGVQVALQMLDAKLSTLRNHAPRKLFAVWEPLRKAAKL